MIRRPPRSPLFPSPTLFRSLGFAGLIAAGAGWKLDSAEAAGAGPAGVASGAITCVLTPELTEGPYYIAGEKQRRRSEEHTSELQSPCNLVCRLLLEKKKNDR